MVTPLKPDIRKGFRAQATPEDVEEYERLLSDRFSTDPSIKIKTLGVAAAESRRENRIRELRAKIFDQRKGGRSPPWYSSIISKLISLIRPPSAPR
jgi:hypothetical protein